MSRALAAILLAYVGALGAISAYLTAAIT